MMQLSFNQRTALVLREIEGLAYHEIADAMGMSLSAVETLLFRARQALREQLEAAEHDVGCEAMQRLISLQLDGNLSRPDKGIVRAHLRSCAECARFARSQRSRKRVMPGLVAVPLPAGLASGFGAGGFGAGGVGGAGLLGSKVAAVAVSAALVGTGTLVRTGVIPIPGKAPDTTAEAATEADSQVGAAPSSVAALVEFRSAQARRAALRASDGRLATKTVVKRRADGPRTAARTRGQAMAAEPSTAPSGGSGESSASAAGVAGAVDVGSAVGGVHVGDAVDAVAGAAGGVTSSPAQVPADPIGTATGAIAGAESNLPSLPASPVTTPSLPPVSLPSTGSLP
jgi:hypothetical protein